MLYLIMNTFNFGPWLEKERLKQGLSMAAFGKLIGRSSGHVNNLEKGTNPPSEATLRQVANALKLDPDWLIAQADTSRPGVVEQVTRILRHAPYAVRRNSGEGDHPFTEEETALMDEAEELGVWTSYLDEPELYDETPEEREWVFNKLRQKIERVRAKLGDNDGET